MPAVGIATGNAQNAPVFVGLGLVALGFLWLWHRQQTYLAFQWLVRYPNHGIVYVMTLFVAPSVLIVAGIGLIIYPLTGW